MIYDTRTNSYVPDLPVERRNFSLHTHDVPGATSSSQFRHRTGGHTYAKVNPYSHDTFK